MNSSPSMPDLPPWFGFLLGLLGGFAVSTGLIGLVIGFSMAGSMGGGTRPVADNAVPNAPSAPTPEPEAPAADVEPVDPKEDHIFGNANAKVTVIEYSDFECPFCKRHFDTMNQLLKTYKADEVNLVFRHFPLSFHANAQKEAEASECAAELGGNNAFWKYHDAIFTRTTANGVGFPLDNLVPLAKELGLNEAKFKDCLDTGKYAAKVKAQQESGIASGVRGTPGSFVINNATKESKSVSGAVPLSDFQAVIDPMLGK